MNVIGLDLSLSRTGVAGHGWTAHLKPKAALRGHQRLDWILDGVRDYTSTADLVVIEGLAFAAHDTNRQSAGLSWLVRHLMLWRRDLAYAVVPPANLKQYVTGNGNAKKERVRAVLATKLGWVTESTILDESDAAALCLMGYDWAGAPLVEFPDVPNRGALAGATWPDTPGLADHAPALVTPTIAATTNPRRTA